MLAGWGISQYRTMSYKYILDIFRLDWCLTPLYRSVLSYSWGVFNIIPTRLKLSVVIVLVSTCLLAIQVNTLYALSITRILTDNSTSPNPSVLRLSPAPLNSSDTVPPSSTLSTPTGPKADTHSGTNIDSTSTSSASGSGSGTSSSGSTSSDHQKKDSDSGVTAQKIINKIKQKFKVGDIPFP